MCIVVCSYGGGEGNAFKGEAVKGNWGERKMLDVGGRKEERK